MNIILAISCSLIWFLILFLTKFSKSKYLVLTSQRNNFVTALHGLIIPIITFIYLISLPAPFSYDYLGDEVIIFFCCLSVGYYIFSTISLILIEKKSDLLMIFHHLVVGSFLSYVVYNPVFPAIYGYILVAQMTALVYHTHLIFKETVGDPNSEKRAAFWYNMNYYSWIFFRFIFQGILTIAVFYYEFTQFLLPPEVRIIMVAGFIASYFFNFLWLISIVKKRKEKKLSLEHV